MKRWTRIGATGRKLRYLQRVVAPWTCVLDLDRWSGREKEPHSLFDEHFEAEAGNFFVSLFQHLCDNSEDPLEVTSEVLGRRKSLNKAKEFLPQHVSGRRLKR
jgi:hypothetical protein